MMPTIVYGWIIPVSLPPRSSCIPNWSLPPACQSHFLGSCRELTGLHSIFKNEIKEVSSQLHFEIDGSIKRDVNKKTSPPTGDREVFCLDIQPTVCRWLSTARAVLLWTALPFSRFIFEC